MPDDHLLRITYSESWGEVHGEALIDLREIAGAAGVRKKEQYFDRQTQKVVSGTYVDMSLAQARKMCRLIARYAEPGDLDKVTAYFMGNEKLSRIWTDERSRYER